MDTYTSVTLVVINSSGFNSNQQTAFCRRKLRQVENVDFWQFFIEMKFDICSDIKFK